MSGTRPCWRIRSRLQFGAGYPFSADEQAHLVQLLREATHDAVHVPVYEYADRLPRHGRDKSSARDVWHPADRDASSAVDVAARLTARAQGAPDRARDALAGLAVAAVSRHRAWLAVCDQRHKDAVRLTPRAGGLLFEAVAALQRHERPLFDVFVDEETWRASPRLGGS